MVAKHQILVCTKNSFLKVKNYKWQKMNHFSGGTYKPPSNLQIY